MSEGIKRLPYPYQCVWCCSSTDTIPCERCGKSETVKDPKRPHRHMWSRRTITSWECKVCGIVWAYETDPEPESFVFEGCARNVDIVKNWVECL